MAHPSPGPQLPAFPRSRRRRPQQQGHCCQRRGPRRLHLLLLMLQLSSLVLLLRVTLQLERPVRQGWNGSPAVAARSIR